MKKINFSLIILSLFIFFSCEKEKVEDSLLNSEKEKVSNLKNYKGLPVSHRFDVPFEQLHNMENGVFKKSNNSDESLLSFEKYSLKQISEIVQNEIKNFPFITTKEELEEKILLLKQDFPTLTDDEIQEKMPLIEEYYHKNLDIITLKKLEEKTSLGKQKNSDYSYIDRIACVADIAFENHGGSLGSSALSATAYYEASTKAQSISTAQYPNLSGTDTKRDAFRHIIWSALLCRYYYTISSKAPKLRFAKAVGDANEICGDNNDDGKEMDYHNNGMGRELYDRNTPYETFLGMTTGLKTPSVELLTNKTKEIIEKAVLITGNTITERAQKIRDKKFYCTTVIFKKHRFICDDVNQDVLELIDNDNPQDPTNEDCWETYYEYHDSCSDNAPVYLKE